MNTLDNLRAREMALLADRARIDEFLRDVRAALQGAQALAEEAKAKVAEQAPEKATEE